MNKNRLFLIATVVIAVLGFAALTWFGKSSTPDKAVATTPAMDMSILIKPHSPTKGANGSLRSKSPPQTKACSTLNNSDRPTTGLRQK